MGAIQKSELAKNFIHLRAYSDYSLGRSTNKIPALVKECVKQQMPALCLADQGNLFGSLELSLECTKHGIKPLIGCVLKVDCLGSNIKTQGQAGLPELLLIAQNSQGYQNLLYLVSHSFLSVEPPELPHITFSMLLKKAEGLVVLCGSVNSPIAQLFAADKHQQAHLLIQQLQQAFHHNLFIELVRHKNQEAPSLEGFLLEIAYQYNIPLVATNPTSYLRPEMYESQDALLCITEGRYMLEENRPRADSEAYFKSATEMAELFADLPEAIENTTLIAVKCSVMAESRAPLLPKFSKDKIKERAELLKQAEQGLKKRLKEVNDQEAHQQYWDRLKFELDVINNMDFPGYFLIVSDFIKWSKLQGIPVGPGRGSGAGSIVAWALEITDLDPIEFGLLFERFLNPERVSMPDFDIDFCQERRDEVITYVRNKYGHDHVAHIITFGKLQARAVLRDVGRVLQLPYGLVDKICKAVPNNPAHPVTLQEAIKLDKELQAQRKNDADIDKLLTISLQLEGVNRHVSTHAAGVVIADRPIIELAPLYVDANSTMPAVQYSLKYAEAAGLTKFDFLGLKTLTVIAKTCQLINKNQVGFDINNIPLDDKKTYEMLSRGETVGVFQFEGAGMKESIKSLRPDCIGDLIALASLYRPGPMDNIPNYVNRKHGLEEVDHIHHSLEPVLKSTYGIIIYQEQVMEIAKVLAGYSLGEADLLRRAMGKKNRVEMEQQKEVFIERAIANNITQENAKEIFSLVEKFASYGFNKSHAAAYAIISYHTAYLKAHYPLEFFTASINLEINDSDKINIFCTDASRFNIAILPPDINKSQSYFSIEDKSIRFGLGGIKNVGVNAMESLVASRAREGGFADLFDLVEKCEPNSLNKRSIENLAKAGALDCLEANRHQSFCNAEILAKYLNRHHQEASTQQISLFTDTGNFKHSMRPALQEQPDWSEKQKLEIEFEALGFYLSSHPVAEYRIKLQKIGVAPAQAIERHATQKAIKLKIAGVIINKKIRSSPKGRFAFLQISDQTSILDASIFNEEILYQNAELIKEGAAVFCEVEVRKDAAGVKTIIEKIYDLHHAMAKIPSTYNICITDTKVVPYICEKLAKSGAEVCLSAMLPDGSQVSFKNTEPQYMSLENVAMLKNLSGIRIVEI